VLPDGTYLVVGGTWTPAQTAFAWTSGDGMTWEPAFVPGSEGVVMSYLTALDDGFVATGNQLFEDRWTSFVWTSPGGVDLLKKPQAIKDAVIKQVLITPDGPLLVADTVKDGERIAAVYDLKAAKAKKGKKGKKVKKAAKAKWVGQLVTDAAPFERAHRMAQSPEGVRVLISWATGEDRSLSYGLWRSEDGKTWSRADAPSIDPDIATQPAAVRWSPSGFVLATNDPADAGATGRLWHSIDGLSWEPVATTKMIFALEDSPLGLLAFTGPPFDPGLERSASTVLWSADGLDWTEMEVPALEQGRIMSAAIAPDGTVVAIGTIEGADLSESLPRIWLGRPRPIE
jgi:hypothetical protein